ncbi:uncharacterized protein PV09_03304 [Verruconis gallopava]|uniref:Amino-acid acetyltransferase, mitochondrial n=1 Tax=Verruconis gallopava TaxID=253628 RepID=A0A0D1YZK9_9PEZI|nr:uncharacterized protein PV09_03304 [Verruconis gallopava]KIW06142.1 hypothetical protein PV09_03304 [Verruconis gallopava]
MRPGRFGLVGRSPTLRTGRDHKCLQCFGRPKYYSSGNEAREEGHGGPRVSPKQQQKMLDRNFFLSVFSASATKRDAKAYLSRYKDDKRTKLDKPTSMLSPSVEHERKERLQKSGVNLGRLYGQARAIEESPVFTQSKLPEEFNLDMNGPLHVAVVKIRAIDDLDKQTRTGVAMTLSQLARLGLLSCVVIEPSVKVMEKSWTDWRKVVMRHAFKLANAISAHSKSGARVLDQVLGISTHGENIQSSVSVKSEISVVMHEYLLATLQRGFIPVIPPIAYTDGLQARRVEADDIMLALTLELAGLSRPIDKHEADKRTPTFVDKVIVLDPLGGLPAADKTDRSHIFVNLEQEYTSVRKELLQLTQVCLEQEHKDNSKSMEGSTSESLAKVRELEQHVKNLKLMKSCLAVLPPSSSALLTTPSEAASSALFSSTTPAPNPTGSSVGTRPKRNPLIHNLLTDKPTISSSLPVSRLSSSLKDYDLASINTNLIPATFFKRGMPLTIIPDPKVAPWVPPGPEGTSLRLDSDPRINFSRLLHLIEDSFGRPLDVNHYLSRINGRIAGIIVAGEYEGGAILTWEDPSPDNSRIRPAVPYLDKFAVLRKSQGSGGVADIIFNAMVRTCLPDGVVWRSRKNNPVNKWYFERSVGTWKLANSQWCMFWTGNDIDFTNTDRSEDEKIERWKDYVNVCSRIEASWADRHDKPPD